MMNQEDLFRKLGAILNELNDQYDYLAKNPRNLNELELELFLANSNFLSEHIQIIRKINNSTVLKALPEHSEDQSVVAQAQTEIQPEISKPGNSALQEPEREGSQDEEDYQSDLFKADQSPASFEFILNDRSLSIEDNVEQKAQHIEETTGRPELDQTEAMEQTDIITEMEKYDETESLEFEAVQEETIPKYPEPIIEEPVIKQKPAVEEPVIKSAPVVNEEAGPEPFLIPKAEDRVAEIRTTLPEDRVEQKLVKPTLNDLLASSLNKGNPVSEQSAPPIKDLKQAINLNDKLLYIKDLFNGYNLAYAEAIELINKMPDFKTADTFLKSNYAVKNNWSAKQATVDKFYALLERRF